jgi:hypothetical protein
MAEIFSGIYLVKRKCAFWRKQVQTPIDGKQLIFWTEKGKRGEESATSDIRPSAIRPPATQITGGH